MVRVGMAHENVRDLGDLLGRGPVLDELQDAVDGISMFTEVVDHEVIRRLFLRVFTWSLDDDG